MDHLNDPAQVTIKLKTTTAETIKQRFWPVVGMHKLDALTRIADRHYIIEKGVVVWSGTSDALRADETVLHRYLGV